MITDYKKRATVTGVKEAYSLFSRVIKMAVEDYGSVDGWGEVGGDTQIVAEKYFIPYLSGTFKIPVDTVRNYNLYTLSNMNFHGAPNYHGQNNAYALSNGMAFNLYMYGGILEIVVDINGLKSPNVLGIDGFVFIVDKKTSILHPAGYEYSRNQLLTNDEGGFPSGKCIRDDLPFGYYRGECCAAVIAKDGWQITKDYPWGNGR